MLNASLRLTIKKFFIRNMLTQSPKRFSVFHRRYPPIVVDQNRNVLSLMLPPKFIFQACFSCHGEPAFTVKREGLSAAILIGIV